MTTTRYPIEGRWSPELIENGWSAVPLTFLDAYAQLGVTPTEAMLLIHLMSYKWDARMPFPSVAKLRKKLGLSDSQVRSLLRRLEKKGLLNRVQRIGRSNIFDVTPLIERLTAEQQRRRQEAQSASSQKGIDYDDDDL